MRGLRQIVSRSRPQALPPQRIRSDRSPVAPGGPARRAIGYAVNSGKPPLTRSIFVTGLVAGLILLTVGCRGKHSRTTVQNEEPEEISTRLASSLKMNDPAAAQQLVKGFYGLEGGAWRWTSKQFTAALHPPVGSPQRGATVTLAISIPPVVIDKLSSVTLTASIAGTKLKSETYSKPASYTFSAEAPADLLGKDPVNVDFALDKALPPGATDTRELGIIVTAVGLETK